MTDADTYSHTLARSSLGLALASGRCRQAPYESNIRDFLSQTGFGDLEYADYDVETARDTIASTIGHKQLPNGDVLIAVGISGLNYGNEWLGNLDIGSATDHRGFSTAANKVVDRVLAYMERHQLGDQCRLWISGFSRAAAVSNLVSAALLEQGVFTHKTAYVYTFATPRTTQDPVAWPNIFNIVGKFDPASKLPYAEWGFERHGINLFTPAQETDSDYRQKKVLVDEVYQKLTGGPLKNDTDINHNFTIIAEYLISIIPTAEAYDTYTYEHLEAVWNNPNLSTLRSLLNALSAPVELSTLSDMEQKEHVEDLVEYLSGIVYGLISDQFAAQDEAASSAASALLMEHSPDIYISWLFSSDDPAAVYSDHMNYLHLMVEGDADVTLFDQKGGFILNVGPDGARSEETTISRFHERILPLDQRPLISVSGAEERMLVLPKDQGFPFVITAHSDSLFSYYGIKYKIDQCRPTATSVRILNMEEDAHYLAYSFTEDGMLRMQAENSVWGDSDIVASIVEENVLLSVQTNSDLEGFSQFSIDLKTILLILIAAFVLLLVLLFLLAIFLIQMIKKIIYLFQKIGTGKRCQPKKTTV